MLTGGGVSIPDWSWSLPAVHQEVVKCLQFLQSRGPWCPCRAGWQCRLWLTPVLLSIAWCLPAGLREGLQMLTGGVCWVPIELRQTSLVPARLHASLRMQIKGGVPSPEVDWSLPTAAADC